MKRFTLFIFTLILLISNIACGKKEKAEDVLRVGMELRWPPFETIDSSGNAMGISVDMAEELGKFLGKKIEIIDSPFGSLIPALETNKIDIIIASMSITEERAEKINFSDPYFYFSLVTLVNKESNIKNKDELFNREALRFVGPKSFVALSIPAEKANNPILREFDDKSSAVLELVQGKADAFIIDPISASEFNRVYPEQTDIIWEPIMQSPIGMGVRQNDTELLEKANKFINQLRENGVYEKLANKYDHIINDSLPGKTLEFYIESI